jgi:hypothetical protein
VQVGGQTGKGGPGGDPGVDGVVTPHGQVLSEQLGRPGRRWGKPGDPVRAPDHPGRVGQAVEPAADLQAVAAGGEQGGRRVQIAAQGRLGGVDPVDLVDQQQPAGGELGRPGGQDRRWVGQVAEQEPAVDQPGGAGRERHHGHVVDGELDPGRRLGLGPAHERPRLVEPEGPPRSNHRGDQHGRSPGPGPPSGWPDHQRLWRGRH